MQVEADGEPWHLLAQHRRHELELVVLHPGDLVLGEGAQRRLGIDPVHLDVRPPPVPVVLGRDQLVVVQRPQGAVAEALVELVDLLLGEGDRHLLDAVVGEWGDVEVGRTGPPDPGAVPLLEDRGEGPHQTARARPPLARLRVLGDGEAVGDDHDATLLSHRSRP